jgi:ribose-phosphate pyrophosphokinase
MNPGSIQGLPAKPWADTRMPSTRKQRRAAVASVVRQERGKSWHWHSVSWLSAADKHRGDWGREVTMMAEDILIFGGSGSPKLTRKICEYLHVQPGTGEVLRFSEGNLFVRVKENVRGRRVYVVQSTVFPANDNFMELLFWIDALKRASAESVTVVMPYFSYAKGDKKDEPRVSIRARVCADAIEVAGADRVVTLDLHAPQIQGFFRIPVDDLYALPVLCEAIVRKQLPDLVVVSPDTGFAKQARKYASFLGTSIAIADKQRKAHDERAEVLEIIGEVQGKTALIVDDFTISAGTLADASEKLVERGAKAVYAAVSHGVFSQGSMERLDRSPIQALLVTDSVETQPVTFSQKVEVVSVAPLFGEAIRRIHNRESVSILFPA